MAIYHLSVKAVSRSAGRSATAAAAYRAGVEIADERTGEIHDYQRKRGVESADLVLPNGAPAWATDRAKLWNAAELAEKRKDACVAREFEVALPSELSPEERRRLAVDFAKEMANREGCAVDVAIHAPGREGDNRNHHAHILRTTRKVGPDGLGDKLDTEKAGRNRRKDLDAVRERWAELTNERLRENGVEARVDHRSLKEQGIDREPTSHKGPAVAGMERRGVSSEVGQRIAVEATDRLAKAKEAGELERQALQVERSIINLGGDLKAAVAERDQQLKIKRGQENEQRISSLERIGSNVCASGENLRATERNIRAASPASRAIELALLASKQHLVAATGHTRSIERGFEGAIKGAERRIAERNYGRIVEAARRKFAVAGDVIQQVVGHIDHAIRPIAAAAQQVAKQIALAANRAKSYYHPDSIAKRAAEAAAAADLAAKQAAKKARPLDEKLAEVTAQLAASTLTPEQRAIVAARVQENAAKERGNQPAPAPEKSDHLTAADRALVQRMDAAIESGDKAELKASYRMLDDVEDKAKRATWENQPTPFLDDRRAAAIQRDTRQRLEDAMNREAKERGETITPWAEMGARIDSAYDHHAKAAAESLAFHRRTQRPEGFFKKAEGREWDAQLQKHEITNAGWESAIKRRDADFAQRLVAAEPGNAAQLERERTAHSAKTAQEAPQRARALDRYESIKQERERQHAALERALGKGYERELERSRGRGIGD